MWRGIRITILLLTLFIVVGVTWLDQRRTTSWEHTVWVGVFPINADASAAAAAYIAALRAAELQPVSDFIAGEARRYGVALEAPVALKLYPPLASPPPALAADANVFARALWSLKLRYYRARVLSSIERSRPQITLFLLYHDPAQASTLPHSAGLQRGLMGVVHLFAARSQAGQNALVVAHELLHTFGATDKYGRDSDAPRFPEGYAEPDRVPRFPQRYAEIMAGRIPLRADLQEMPLDLSQALVGPATAREIGWHARP